jgi:hypothetical protein
MVKKHMTPVFTSIFNKEKSLGNIKFGEAPDDYEEYDAQRTFVSWREDPAGFYQGEVDHNGAKDGKGILLTPTCNCISISYWKANIHNGSELMLIFHPFSEFKTECSWLDGKLHGACVRYFDEEGRLTQTYEKGKCIHEE